MKTTAFLTILALVALVQTARAEPAMTKVNATNTIRCGYVDYVPSLSKNAQTGAWEGFDAEVIAAIANRLDLKVEYTAKSSWATVVADLNAGKFDMLCSAFWVHPNVGKFALFSKPAFLQPIFVVARADDARFATLPNLDDPALKMVAIEGDNPVAVAHADFPKAQVIELPNMTDFSQVLLEVAASKADFTIVDAMTFGNYNKNNPGKLKVVEAKKPIRVYPASYVFRAEDGQFRDAVNAALDELILDGSMDRIFKKYALYPDTYYLPVVPYRYPN